MDDLSYLDLFRILRSNNLNLSDHLSLLRHILLKIKCNLSELEQKSLTESLRIFCIHVNKRWIKSSRNEKTFLRQNESWLEGSLNLPRKTSSLRPTVHETERSAESPSFLELSDRQKRRRTEALRAENSENELMFAAKVKMQASGNQDIAAILAFLMENPDQVLRVRNFCEGKLREKQSAYSKEKGLAIMLALKLSQSKYIALRKLSEEGGSNRYPSYHDVLAAKKECYPPDADIEITETYAQIKLQALLDLTTRKLVKVLNIDINEKRKMTLICKWGFDGASGQSNYKQRFYDAHEKSDHDKPADSSVIVTSLVPIQLVADTDDVLWQNPQPSSTQYCRPIKFEFRSETVEAIKAEHNRMQIEIDNLRPIFISEKFEVKYRLLLTMIDGKICSTLAESSSSMTCYICGATPREMNNLEAVSLKSCQTDHYRFGMSSLHAWIRCMEFLLHVAYNLEIQTWSVRKAEEKVLKLKRKEKIQQNFRERLGLLVDVIKQGVGTTNDGNTSRRFFENPSITAEITGLDETIIYKFSVILQVIASGKEIDVEKFDAYGKNLAKLVVNTYPWYYMPASVHKILLHGSEIIKHALVPIGQLSEESVEARHKEFRHFRLHHTRKNNRIETNTDIMHMLLLTSDPYICSLKISVKKRKEKQMYSEAMELLIPAKTEQAESELDDEEDDEEEEET